MDKIRVQLENWHIDNDQPDNEGRPLCMALANIVSMLIATKRVDRAPQKIVPYSGQKEKFLTKVEEFFAKGERQRFVSLLPRARAVVQR